MKAKNKNRTKNSAKDRQTLIIGGTPIDLSPRDILQLNATLITGILIFTSLVNITDISPLSTFKTGNNNNTKLAPFPNLETKHNYERSFAIFSVSAFVLILTAYIIMIFVISSKYALENNIDKGIKYFLRGLYGVAVIVVIILAWIAILALA